MAELYSVTGVCCGSRQQLIYCDSVHCFDSLNDKIIDYQKDLTRAERVNLSVASRTLVLELCSSCISDY